MSEKFVVHKFGGTSVGDAKCFANVSNIVSGIESSKVAVVVSAIGGKPKVTDLLISLLDLAKQRKSEECEKVLKIIHEKHKAVVKTLLPTEVGTPIAESIDEDLKRLSELLRAISIMRSYNESVVEFISGHGEVWSAKILTAVLNERMKNDQRSERFHFVDAREVLTVDPDDDHGHVIQYEATRESLHEFMQQQGGATHLVITGFICSTTEGVMTTLKRDGSDFTASIFGRVLSASSITIWTDVSGVLSADPRRVPESKILQEISYQEAMELAYFGAKVIHPKTMTPAIMENIPIYIRNTFEPSHPGTKIFSRESTKLTRSFSGNFTARTIVSGFSTVDNLALFNIEGSGMVGVHGTSSRLFGALDRVKVNVVLIAQASSEHSICFAIPMNRAAEVKEVVDETFFKEIHHGLIEKTEYISPISIIAAVGDNMSQTPGVCARFFGALGRCGINVLGISQGSSERNISAVVRYEDSAAALRAVHSAFFLSDQTISIGIVGLRSQASKNGIGKELLAQYDQQSSYLKMRFNVDIRIRAIATVDNMMVLGQDNGSIKASEVEDKSRFVTFDEAAFRKHVCADHLPHWLIIDVSDNVNYVENYYSTWLSSRTHVISANVNVAACSASRYSTTSAKTCEKEVILDIEACVAVGVPIISTLRNFLQTGDCVQRVEFSSNAFLNSLLLQSQQYGKTKSFEALLKEQFKKFKKNLSVEEILDDLRGIVCAKRAILITRELGYCSELNQVEIKSAIDEQSIPEGTKSWSYDDLEKFLLDDKSGLSSALKSDANRRLMTHIDGLKGKIRVVIEEVAPKHPFASLEGLQCGFAFYTTRHALHPVVVTGPLADTSITASTLFGSILSLARNCGARDSGASC